MTQPRPSSLPRLCVECKTDKLDAPSTACYDASHTHLPNPEWLITEDGVPFKVGDRLFNYYDNVWGTVDTEPDERTGWFYFRSDAGGLTSLNSVRVASKEPRRR